MGLFGRSKESVGLDIGSGFVKVVVVDHSGDQPEVSGVAMRPLVADAIVEGEVMDPGLVSDTIRDVFQEIGVKGKAVITALGGHDVIIKKIEMDRMKESDAREVIRWEAEQHVPFDIKSVELDFQILDPLEEGMQMQVLLVAAKRELVDHKVELAARRRAFSRGHRYRCLRTPQRFCPQPPGGDEGNRGSGQHWARDHQREYPRGRKPSSHAGHPLRVEEGASGPTAGEGAHGGAG